PGRLDMTTSRPSVRQGCFAIPRRAREVATAEHHSPSTPGLQRTPGTSVRDATPRNRDVPVARPGEFHPLRLGALSIWPPVVLAPMAGVTNYPFRTLCREFGAGLYVSEMITARGFLQGNHMTPLLASSRPRAPPPSVP